MKDILKYKNYFASVHYNAIDEVFHGKVIGISDTISFEGTTVKELKDAFGEAVDEYIEDCKILNKEPEKMYKGSFNVRIPVDLHKQAAIYSSSKNMSLNDFVRYAIDFALSKMGDSNLKLHDKIHLIE